MQLKKINIQGVIFNIIITFVACNDKIEQLLPQELLEIKISVTYYDSLKVLPCSRPRFRVKSYDHCSSFSWLF